MKEPLVHILGNFQGMSGYSQHTIHFQRALAQQCRCLATDPNWPAQQNAETLRQLQEAAQRGESVVNIALFSLDHAHLLAPFPGWKIGFAVWESTVVEESWMQASRTLDGVWTATQWNRQVFIHNGMEPAKVQVVPEGVDPDLFSPNGDLFSQLQQDPRYKFLIVGKFEERKKTAAMIRAFDDVFHGQQDVMLLLLCHNHFVPNFDINRELQKLSLKNKNNIAAGAWVPTSDILAKIYRSCNVFLAASRAEGWGLPICEAMACGLPTIVTHYSGPTEFIHGDNALLLDYTLTPIPANHFVRAKDPGVWAEPDMAQFGRLLRWCYEHQEQAKQIGLQAAREIRQEWSWQQAAKKALTLMGRHYGQPPPNDSCRPPWGSP